MRNLVFLLSLSLLLGIKAQCQNVDQIVIEKSPPPQGIPICISSCQECGKLIFYSFIAGLKFESQMGNIMEQTIETEVTEYGYQKFTYKVVTRGLPIQNIIIKGPTVSNYDLEVTDLKPATCQYFIVNFRRPDTKGAFLVKTNPSGAKLTIKDEPQFTEVTPFLIKDHVTGNFRIKLEKAGYNTVDTTIIILADKESEISLNLKPLFTAPPPPPPTDQKIIMQNEIKKHGRNQVIWLGSTILAAGTGGYFMIAADKKYQLIPMRTNFIKQLSFMISWDLHFWDWQQCAQLNLHFRQLKRVKTISSSNYTSMVREQSSHTIFKFV
jgi:hypothetical protein